MTHLSCCLELSFKILHLQLELGEITSLTDVYGVVDSSGHHVTRFVYANAVLSSPNSFCHI